MRLVTAPASSDSTTDSSRSNACHDICWNLSMFQYRYRKGWPDDGQPFLSGKVPCKVSGGSSDAYVNGKRCKYWPVFTPFGPKLTFRAKNASFLHRFLAIWRNSYLPRTQLTIILSVPQAILNSPGSRTQFREWSTYAKSSAYKRKVTVLVSPGRSSTFV